MEYSTRQAVSSKDFSPLMANRAPTTNSVSSEDFSPLINNGEYSAYYKQTRSDRP
ncbi:hypothetical protein [Coleofasciculus chthonoplastes]|jgi:hypothetical protein|uniref:hypothetical protein n=1 Tax=Coleofasciculus chthonoplastes TaxID=64178 RepID=UPI0032F39A7A